ncbi:MAG TPA: hypothetical protein VNU25_01645 [Candidatus Paceibacterota bacterium]|nr:hypothetical protein [Candidatus Paceibacterota bacterium]
MKNTLLIGGLAVALLAVGGILWSRAPENADPSVVARNGLHWHPTLEIYVKGEKVEIPPDVGVGDRYAGMPTYDPGMRMTAMHTHEDMPIIHLEFLGLVRNDDITLGNFFTIWGKDMRSFGTNMRMTVNGRENTEFENYLMKDGDVITLHFD